MSVERDIQRYEIEGLRLLHITMVRRLGWASEMNVAPLTRARMRRHAAKRVEFFFEEVERVLKERIDRGAVKITGAEDPKRGKPPRKEAA